MHLQVPVQPRTYKLAIMRMNMHACTHTQNKGEAISGARPPSPACSNSQHCAFLAPVHTTAPPCASRTHTKAFTEAIWPAMHCKQCAF